MGQQLLIPWQQYGLLGLTIGSITFLLFLVIKWTLETTKSILAQAAKEREAWTKAISDHTEQAKAFHESVKEAHDYQREEHRKLAEQQLKTCLCMEQVEKALGRINGYKI